MLSKGVFAMKKRVALLVALCIWKVVAAQTPYGEMPERFWPDTLPCRLGGGVCFGMNGLDAAIPRGGGASSCRDPRVVFVAGDTLITFISVAGVANTRSGTLSAGFTAGTWRASFPGRAE